MKALRQTIETNDIYLADNTSRIEFASASDKQAYAYILSDAIRTVRGEMQLDSNLGIPYFDTIFKNQNRVNIWKHYVTELVRSYDFVVGIIRFDYEIDSNSKTLKYELEVETVDGNVIITNPDPNGIVDGVGGGCGMCSLTQEGIFYLPVFLHNGIQIYRQLKEYTLDGVVTTELSDETYIRNSEGLYVRWEAS